MQEERKGRWRLAVSASTDELAHALPEPACREPEALTARVMHALLGESQSAPGALGALNVADLQQWVEQGGFFPAATCKLYLRVQKPSLKGEPVGPDIQEQVERMARAWFADKGFCVAPPSMTHASFNALVGRSGLNAVEIRPELRFESGSVETLNFFLLSAPRDELLGEVGATARIRDGTPEILTRALVPKVCQEALEEGNWQ